MGKLVYPGSLLPASGKGRGIKYLSETQANRLVEVWQEWYDLAKTPGRRRRRGRYWLTFLVLRFTGARVGEVILLDDVQDINFRTAEIMMPTLKRKESVKRIVFVPHNVTSEIATYLAEFPEMRGEVFQLQHQNFRNTFYMLAEKADIPRELAHPHVLRHTRALEMLRAGVPVTIVQDQLGHAFLTTTAVYLRISGAEARQILKDKGLV